MRASRRGTGCCRGSGCSPCPAATRWPGKAPEGPRASHPAGPPPAPLIPQAPPPPRQSPLLLFKTTGFCPRSALQVSSHSLMDWGSDRAPRAPRGDEGGPLPRAPGSPRPSFKTSISSSLSFRAWAPLGTAVSRGGTVKPIAPGENSFLPGADPPLAPRPSGSLPVPARRRRLPRRPRPHALRPGSARRGRGGRGGCSAAGTAGPARPRRAPHTQQPRAGRSLEAVFLRPRCRPYRLQQRCLLPRVFVGSAAAQRWEGTCRTLGPLPLATRWSWRCAPRLGLGPGPECPSMGSWPFPPAGAPEKCLFMAPCVWSPASAGHGLGECWGTSFRGVDVGSAVYRAALCVRPTPALAQHKSWGPTATL